jgi:hypothetical protein
MKLCKETFLVNISHLQDRLKNSPFQEDLSGEVKKILIEAPKLLERIKSDLNNNLIPDFNRLDQILQEISAAVIWACGESRGRIMAENAKAGNMNDLSIPVNMRLQQRQIIFLSEYLGVEGYLNLVKEWEGEDAVQGKTVHMDPREIESFGYWMFHDKIIPGQNRRLIDIFVDKVMKELPEDEKTFLKALHTDRPSFYKVISLKKHQPYLVKDLLNNDELRIKDMLSSETLYQGAIFLGRSYLLDDEKKLFGLLGKIDVLTKELWIKLSPYIDEMLKKHRELNTKDAFRACHIDIRKRIDMLVGL